MGRRFNSPCALCRSRENLALDHVVPQALGGTDDPSNLRVLCGSCNSIKGARQLSDQAIHLRNAARRLYAAMETEAISFLRLDRAATGWDLRSTARWTLPDLGDDLVSDLLAAIRWEATHWGHWRYGWDDCSENGVRAAKLACVSARLTDLGIRPEPILAPRYESLRFDQKREQKWLLDKGHERRRNIALEGAATRRRHEASIERMIHEHSPNCRWVNYSLSLFGVRSEARRAKILSRFDGSCACPTCPTYEDAIREQEQRGRERAIEVRAHLDPYGAHGARS